MAVVRAEALAVVCVPAANVLILCGGENQITITVIPVVESVAARATWRGSGRSYLIWVSARSYKGC